MFNRDFVLQNPLLSGYDPMTSLNRHVRTRMRGGVGRDGEKPFLPRLAALQLQVYESSQEDIFHTSPRIKD
jgi:hypothetical protein